MEALIEFVKQKTLNGGPGWREGVRIEKGEGGEGGLNSVRE